MHQRAERRSGSSGLLGGSGEVRRAGAPTREAGDKIEGELPTMGGLRWEIGRDRGQGRWRGFGVEELMWGG